MAKRLLGILTIIFALLLSACGAQQAQSESTQDGKLSIVTTSYHEYDWVMQILGENADNFNVTLLMNEGVDLHSYEPNIEDISIITTSDLYIFNGGPSHDWIFDLLQQPANANLNTLSIIEVLGDAVKDEVMVEGMQASSHEHDHAEDEHDHAEDEHDHAEDDHDHAEDDHDHAEDEHDHAEDEHDHAEDEHDHAEDEHADGAHADEHVWLSLNNAIVACENIAQKIIKLDPENADAYLLSAESYTQKLKDLHADYEQAIEDANRDTLIFADRFPFLYMMQDYDVNYFAAFQGCDAETEASVDTITFLTEKINELDTQKVIVIDNGLVDLAAIIISSSENKDGETLILHSMQSVSAQDIEAGATYYNYMSENLEVIKQALA